MLLPTGANDQRMTTAKRQTLTDFMFYSLCEGQSKAGAYGYSPLPLNLVQAGFDQLKKLSTADPAVDFKNRDVTKCNNPTFVGRRPVEEQAGRDRAAAGGLRQGRRGSVRHRAPARLPARRRPQRPADGGAGRRPRAAGGSGDARPAEAPVRPRRGRRRLTTRRSRRPASTGEAAGGQRRPRRRRGRRHRPSWPRAAPATAKVFGALAVVELLAIVLLPGLGVVAAAPPRQAGAAS